MNLTFRQLKVFVEVARLGSVVRAAENLHLTPPAVSLQIKAIERETGQVLFDRANKRMNLTASGEFFHVHARRLLGSLKEAEEAMEGFGRLEAGHITIAMVSSANYYLPHLLAGFHELHKSVEIRLRLGSRDQIDVMLEENEVDLCVTGRPPRKVPVIAQPFAMHPHNLIMSPKHRLAGAEHIPAHMLANEPFIVREPESGTRSALQEYLDAHHIEPNFVMEMASNEAIKQAVMANLGVALVSRHILALELHNGLILTPSVEGLPLIRRWHVVHAASKRLSPAATALRDYIVEHGEHYLGSMFSPGVDR